ncbi:MAG TPA: alpha-1,4-glucan--maltose-1-phosphate maltosyltransferase [Candidatus Acidoferrales bacterium]|nr:alpha-1,4-glucan--maltose-1-phosphate maltosyltransferase [Candidatus Acidoferrales bacterium]
MDRQHNFDLSKPATGHPERVTITNVLPELNGGRYPIKRIVGDEVQVTADIFADGHEVLSALLLHRTDKQTLWNEVPMEPVENDRWQASFRVSSIGQHVYTLQGWIDVFRTWRRDMIKRVEAGQHASVDLLIGAGLIAQAADRANGADSVELRKLADAVRAHAERDLGRAAERALDERVALLMDRYPDKRLASTYEKALRIVVDREKARFSSWYEMFPRSCSPKPGRHGTFRDCLARLPYVAEMGFDVVYLPPIHPIGCMHRKGKNNSTVAAPDDFGSPWAIGSRDGGHKSILRELGTVEDFRALVEATRQKGMEIALDIAYQCAPDHPYVREHPEWFRIRPDGTVQYAENPPKKYEDIVPINFDTEQWRELWTELKDVILFWIGHGVRIFRVDNPHTKPFSFWEWVIAEIKRDHPDVLFLAEAFTRPKVMYELAKRGFSQSYTYFTWRNTKLELEEYFTELTQTEVREFFRPNLWPNTPDILAEYLQSGGRPAFMARAVLAGTLGANYGIYGPAFELCENRPIRAGSEEYLDSEKYQLRNWDLGRPDSLKDWMARINQGRRENVCLQSDAGLQFHSVDNDNFIAYSKSVEDLSSLVVVVVNLNPYQKHSGWLTLPLEALGLSEHQPYQMHDLLSDARYIWQGPRNYVELDPAVAPAHIFRVRRRVRSGQDFDYFE